MSSSDALEGGADHGTFLKVLIRSNSEDPSGIRSGLSVVRRNELSVLLGNLLILQFRPRYTACCLPCPGPRDCGPLDPPFGPSPNGAPALVEGLLLALPIHTDQFPAFRDQLLPDALQNAQLHPALEGSVNCAVVPQSPGQPARRRNMMPSGVGLG